MKEEKQSKHCMNILFYTRMDFRNMSTPVVHIMELSSNLSKLGYNLKIAEVAYPKKKKALRFKHGTFSDCFKNIDIRLFFLTIITVLKEKRKPNVIYTRHGSLCCTGYFLAKLFRIPLVTEVNGIVVDEKQIMGHSNNVLLRIVDKIERFNLSKANKIVVVTTKLKQVLHVDYKIPEDKIVVIQNGANIELFKPMNSIKAKKELNLNQNDNYICFVGTLSPHQGADYLVKCAPLVLKKCPTARFLIVGYGKLEQELKDLAGQMAVSDKFIFTGAVPYEEVPLYINACDLCVVPKRPWKYGYSPLKLHEYMACEKPVVATRTDGFEDLEKYNAGILINPENSDDFADAIIKLLKDKDVRKKMGKNGREYVVKNHSWESVARSVAKVCESAISEHKNKRR